MQLVSRNGNVFKSFSGLCDGLARDLKTRRCVLDGEIVCLDSQGKPQFRDLLFRRAELLFYAFDLLWDEHAWSDDEEERHRVPQRRGHTLPPADRPQAPPSNHSAQPRQTAPVLYHVERDGGGLFRLACENDLEGIVAKRISDPYLLEHAAWRKIRNQAYSQWVGREELFERERSTDPDVAGWDACVRACAASAGAD